MQTILLHIQADPRVEGRIEDAITLASALDAHLDVLHITPEDVTATFESFGGIDPDGSGARNFAEAENALEAKVKADMERCGVSWEYHRVEGSTGAALASRAALCDLIVTGRLSHRSQSKDQALRMIGDLLIGSRAPVFLRGDEVERYDPTTPAVIAWDGSFEAANAVAMGLSVLRQSREVHVVRVSEGGREVPSGLYPLTRILKYLSRHDIHADYSRIAEVDGKTVPALLEFAASKQAGLLVSGGYTQSRIGQRLFGGVTRSLLKHCPIALMMAH